MKAKDALDRWALSRAQDTLSHFNHHMERLGWEPQELDLSTLTYAFVIAEEIRCCDGHSPEECPSSYAARPVIRVTVKTEGGNELRTETHAGDFRLFEFFDSVIEAAGEPLTL